MGYIDPAVAVDQISIKPNNTLGSFRAEIVVSSKKTGLHIVCVQTFNTTKVNKDELCITLSMSADAMTIFSDETVPHFLEPSLQPDAVTRCAVNETCHVWYTYTSGIHNKADIELLTDTLKTGLYRTECKTIRSAEKNCSLDIFLRPRTDEVGKSFKICVSLSVKSNPTVKGENRCFTMNVVQESALDDQRRCRQHQCEHNGFCDGHGTSAKCYCPQGFEGSNCEHEYTPNFAGKSSSIAGDTAVPKAIGCKLNMVCHVPLQLFLNQGRCAAPQIRAGYRSSGINFVKATMTSVQEGNRAQNFSGSAELMPTQTGMQHICLQAVNNGTTLSEFCFELTVKGPTDENLKRPYFIEPTYLNGATLFCQKNKDCHFTLHYARGEKFDSEQECPGVKDTYPVAHNAGQLLRTFTTEVECYNDVLLTATFIEIIKLCFQLELPRNIGEERCFYIEVVDDLSTKVKTPCDGITCSPWQVCISNLTASVSPPYSCVNETDYVAKTTQDVAIFVDLPPYTESLGCASDTCTVPLYVQSPINEITSVEVSRGQNKSVFNVNHLQKACHNYVEVYRADLQVTASKLDPAQALCLMANDSNGLASDVTCILPKPPTEEGMNVGMIVGGAVGGVAAIGGGVAAAVFLRKKQCVKKIMSRRQSKVDTPESKKTSKNGSKNGVSVIEMDTTTDNEQITEIILSMKVKKSKV
uniref:Arginase type I-like protein n=1 Tax=Sinonovacula constricta TaxID=98310 RepID=A0A513U814_SINCO|nr:arginase type I-like protein [Sinonovacula constricta]